MANNININQITGDVSGLNTVLAKTAEQIKLLIDETEKINTKLSGSSGLVGLTNAVTKAQENQIKLQQEQNKLLLSNEKLVSAKLKQQEQEIKNEKELENKKAAHYKKIQEIKKTREQHLKVKKQELDIEIKERKEKERLTKQTERLNKQIEKENREYVKLTKNLNDARNKAKDLAAQYGVNSKQFKEAQKNVLSLDKEVKNIDASLGQHQRNVGNYGSAISGLFKGMLGKFGLMIGATKVLKNVLESAFLGTQSNMDFFRVKTTRLQTEFQILNDEIAKVGKSIVDNFNENDGEGKKSVSFLTSMTLMVGGLARNLFPGLSASITKTAIDMNEAGNASEELTMRLIALEKAETDLSLTNAVRRREIKERIFLTRDENIAFADRMRALKEANKIENEILQSQQAMLRERLAIRFVQNEITDEQIAQIAKEGVISDTIGLTLTNEKERAEVVAEVTRYYENQTATIDKQRQLLNRINTLNKQWRSDTAAISKDLDEVAKNLKNPIQSALESNPDELTIKTREVTQELLDTVNKYIDDSPISFWDSFTALDPSTKAQLISEFTSIGNTLFDLGQAQRDRELDSIRANYDARIQAAGDNAEVVERLEKELAIEQARIEREQAISERNQALFSIAISTSQAIMSAWKNPFAAPALIPTIVASSILQTALVASQPLPEIPEFFKGTADAPAGLKWVAERGSELINMPDGRSFLATQKMLINTPGGEEILTHEKTMQEINRAIYNSIGYSNDNILNNTLDKLANSVGNLKQVNVMFDADGMAIYMQQGNNMTKYLNKKGRK